MRRWGGGVNGDDQREGKGIRVKKGKTSRQGVEGRETGRRRDGGG